MDSNLFVKDLLNRIATHFEETLLELEKKDLKTADILKESKYAIFYSNPLETLTEGPIYYLGLNPGGSPELGEEYEVQDFKYFKEKAKAQPLWSEFLHEKWKTKKRCFKDGNNPHQRRAKDALTLILGIMGQDTDIGKVFCTNLYFFRSKDTDTLSKFLSYIDDDSIARWLKYHNEFLYRVKPRVVVCNGNGDRSAFSKLWEHLSGTKIDRHKVGEKYYLKSFCIQANFNGQIEIPVIGFPHFSRFGLPKDSLLAEVCKRLIEGTQP